MTHAILVISKQPGERDIMWTKKKTASKKMGVRRLSAVILEYLFFSALVSLFTFLFLFNTSVSIGEKYLLHRGITLTEVQNLTFHMWLRSICVIASITIFTFLFLFMLGQRLSYLITIIQGIEKLRENRMDYDIPLEGNDELTQLAGSINFLSSTERELARKEQELKEEREEWIRALSHDIRTPLTSLLSYSEFMLDRESLSEEEMRTYIDLVYSKSSQIRELTSQLIERKDGNWEPIENVHFLLEQLTEEWLEILEDRFSCQIDLSGCENFSGILDIYSLRRILDNLASNIEKYADPSAPVTLQLRTDGRQLILLQSNRKAATAVSAESHRIGLASIRQTASLYDGRVEIISPEAASGIPEEKQLFQIQIILNIRPYL